MAITYLSGERIQGEFGSAEADGYADFDGSGDYATAGAVTDFSFLHKDQDWSLSFWMYLNATPGSSEPMPFGTNGASATPVGAGMHMDTSNRIWWISGGGSYTFQQQNCGTLSNTTWYHVVVTQDASEDEIVISITPDGGSTTNNTIDISGASWNTGNSTYAMIIGRNALGTGHFNGRVSDFALWNGHVLSPGDKIKLKDGTRITDDGTGFDYSSGNITNHWTLFTDWTDSKGGKDGTASGDPTFGSTAVPTATSAPDDKSTITNVPVGTRFEETDTRKIYRWGGGGNSLGSDGDVTNQGATLDTSNEKLGTGCLDFDGSNDYINMTSLLTNDAMTTAGTISFWINFDAVGNGKKIWQFGETGGSYGSADTIYVEIESDLPNSKIMMGCQHGSNTESWTIRTPTGLLSTGTWFHVVMTQDGTSPKIYINATDRTIQSTTTDLTKWVSTLTDLNSFDWGRYNHIGSTTGYVDAKFDDIGIWNRALTSSEVTSLYNSGTGALCSTIPSGLRAYFNCNSATVTNNIKGWTEKGTA